GYYQAFVRSKDPPAFMVLLEDSAALVGIVIAAAATSAAVWLSQPVWDGVGSILIGILLGITSVGLARESKSLLIGEPAHPELALSRRSGQTPGRKVLVCTSSMESRLVCASAAPGWQMAIEAERQKSTSALMPSRRGGTSAFRVRMLYSQVVSLIPIWNGGTR